MACRRCLSCCISCAERPSALRWTAGQYRPWCRVRWRQEGRQPLPVEPGRPQGAPPYLQAEPLQRLAVEQQRLPTIKTAAAAAGHGLAVKAAAVVLAGTVAVGGGYTAMHMISSAPQEPDVSEASSQQEEIPNPVSDPEAPRKAAMLAALDEAADWALYAKLIDMGGDGTEELLIGGGQPSEYVGGDRVGYGLIAYTWDGETLTPVSLCKKTMPDLDEEVALFRRTTTGEIYVGYTSHTSNQDLRLEALSGCVRLSGNFDPDYTFYEYEEPFNRVFADPAPPTVAQSVYEQHLDKFKEIERIIGVDYDVDPEQAMLEIDWPRYWNPDESYGDVVEQRPPLLKISSTLETVREQLQPAETAA